MDAAESDEFSDATLERMVREVRPDWTVRRTVPADEGTDAVYFVTVDTPGDFREDGLTECVLKVCEFLDPEAFRPEPYLMTLVERRTSVPVPAVVGAVDDHDDLPAPFFLMDRVDGEVRENGARDLSDGVVERIARNAGRHLAELHALGEFEAFGPIRLARDEERGDECSVSERALAVDNRALTVGETGRDSWRTRFEEFTDFTFENLDDRFGDLEAPLRAFVEEHLDALDRTFPAVLGHDDYRLGNVLVDSETGETTAVLDWGNAHTLEAQYNLVLTEQYLSGWAPHDDPRRERVRGALHEGYLETGERETVPGDERRRELYLATTRLFPMAWFSLWYGDQSDTAREETAEWHRRAARNLLD